MQWGRSSSISCFATRLRPASPSSTRCRRASCSISSSLSRSFPSLDGCSCGPSRARRSSSLASRPVPLRPGRFLPPDPRVEGPFRRTPQLAFRIGILGFLALAAFSVLFFRLWALQVLSGNQFLRAAQNNQLRTVRIEAPRGPIKDRAGHILVGNANGLAVRLWPANLPDKGAYAEVRRLARILNVPLAEVTRQLAQHRNDPVTPVTVKEFVSKAKATYLLERKSEFPGMTIQKTYVRRYAYGDLAAQLLGYVGEISPQQLKEKHGYRLGDRIGQGGIEASYDRYLRGRVGIEQQRVDALGRRRGQAHAGREAPTGRSASDRGRNQPRRRQPQLVRERRRDRRARSARRGDPRARLVPDLRPVGLLRPRQAQRPRAAARPTRRRRGELPRARPGDLRRLSAGLDVQAGHRPRGHAGAHP